jgi:hypothetical protein
MTAPECARRLAAQFVNAPIPAPPCASDTVMQYSVLAAYIMRPEQRKPHLAHERPESGFLRRREKRK